MNLTRAIAIVLASVACSSAAVAQTPQTTTIQLHAVPSQYYRYPGAPGIAIITQMRDGLHIMAGFDENHGSVKLHSAHGALVVGRCDAIQRAPRPHFEVRSDRRGGTIVLRGAKLADYWGKGAIIFFKATDWIISCGNVG